MKNLIILAICMIFVGVSAQAKRTRSPKGAQVYFISPQDGQTVTSPVTVRFGLKNMGVAPAGIDIPKTGHHHLIIDSPLPNTKKSVPKDDKHIHYGGGQTEAEITLPKGKHTLQLLLGDHTHTPHLPVVKSKKITITVK